MKRNWNCVIYTGNDLVFVLQFFKLTPYMLHCQLSLLHCKFLEIIIQQFELFCPHIRNLHFSKFQFKISVRDARNERQIIFLHTKFMWVNNELEERSSLTKLVETGWERLDYISQFPRKKTASFYSQIKQNVIYVKILEISSLIFCTACRRSVAVGLLSLSTFRRDTVIYMM